MVVPPQINPDMVERQNSTGDTVMVKFQHKKVRVVQTDICMMSVCMMHLLVNKKNKDIFNKLVNFLTGARLIGFAFLVYLEQRLSCNFGFLYMLFFF